MDAARAICKLGTAVGAVQFRTPGEERLSVVKASEDWPRAGSTIRPAPLPGAEPARAKRRGGWLFPALAIALGSQGCDALQGDRVSCKDSVDTLRRAIGYADFESARAWREYAWNVCDDKSALNALDQEILEAEKQHRETQAEASPEAKATAQTRINAAQSLWLAFDRLVSRQRTLERLTKTRESADQLAAGLTSGYGAKLREYNEAQHKSRVAKLGKAK